MAAEPGTRSTERPRVRKSPKGGQPVLRVEVVPAPEGAAPLDTEKVAGLLVDLLRRHGESSGSGR